MATLAKDLGLFVSLLTLRGLPPEVVDKAKSKSCLLNAYGMGLDCHDTPYAPVARATALAMDGELQNGATLLADGRRTTIGGACLANAALFVGRGQADTCGAAHFGTIIVSLRSTERHVMGACWSPRQAANGAISFLIEPC